MLRILVVTLTMMQPAVALAQATEDDFGGNIGEQEDLDGDVQPDLDRDGEDRNTISAYDTDYASNQSTIRAPAVPQVHEFNVGLDMVAATRSNSALVDLGYRYSPGSLNRRDEVVPALRRFVRQPSSLHARLAREGGTLQTTTSVYGGGELVLLNGRLSAGLEVGIAHTAVDWVQEEKSYWTLPTRSEVAFRPVSLVELAATYDFRPVIGAGENERIQTAKRTGSEHKPGVALRFATSNDRLLVELGARYRITNWEYAGFHPGALKVRGVEPRLQAQWQVTTNLSMGLLGEVAILHWDNQRIGEDNRPIPPAMMATGSYVGEAVERDTVEVDGEVYALYWFEGRWGFRLSMGGGFVAEPPIFYAEDRNGGDRNLFSLGLGFVSRF